MSGLIPLVSRTQNNLQPRGQNVDKPKHLRVFLLLSWSKDLKLREVREERLLLHTGRGIKTCTFLHFWAQVKAKATEAGRGRRCARPASIMESLWLSDEALPGDQSGVGAAVPRLVVLRGDCPFGPHPVAHGRMTSLGSLLTTCRGMRRP